MQTELTKVLQTGGSVQKRLSMSKRVFTALEKVFSAEIAGHIFQSKARIYVELELEGYVQFDSEVFGAGTRFPATCYGWCLTHKGRMAYGEACKSVSDEQ